MVFGALKHSEPWFWVFYHIKLLNVLAIRYVFQHSNSLRFFSLDFSYYFIDIFFKKNALKKWKSWTVIIINKRGDWYHSKGKERFHSTMIETFQHPSVWLRNLWANEDSKTHWRDITSFTIFLPNLRRLCLHVDIGTLPALLSLPPLCLSLIPHSLPCMVRPASVQVKKGRKMKSGFGTTLFPSLFWKGSLHPHTTSRNLLWVPAIYSPRVKSISVSTC